MADVSGRPDLAVGDIAVSGAEIMEFEAAAAITKGDPVYLSADNKVSPATSAQDCIGIAVKNVALGAMCPVCTRGVVKVVAGGAITRGKAVYGADATKRVLMLNDQAVNEGGTATYTIFYNRVLGYAQQSTTLAGDLLLIKVTK